MKRRQSQAPLLEDFELCFCLLEFSETEKEIEDKPYSDRENERGARGKPQRRSLQERSTGQGPPRPASPSCSNTRPGGERPEEVRCDCSEVAASRAS